MPSGSCPFRSDAAMHRQRFFRRQVKPMAHGIGEVPVRLGAWAVSAGPVTLDKPGSRPRRGSLVERSGHDTWHHSLRGESKHSRHNSIQAEAKLSMYAIRNRVIQM